MRALMTALVALALTAMVASVGLFPASSEVAETRTLRHGPDYVAPPPAIPVS